MPTPPSNVPSLTHANRHLGGEDDLGLAAVALSGEYSDLIGKPSIPVGIPVGGTTGEGLVKNSATDDDVVWALLQQILSGNNTTINTDLTMTPNRQYQVDTSGGNRSEALPAGEPLGSWIQIEKSTNDTNKVTVTGNIRGVAASSLDIVVYKQSLLFVVDSSGSWVPIAGHLTVSALDGRYELKLTTGVKSSLPSTGTASKVFYFATDTKELYADLTNASAYTLISTQTTIETVDAIGNTGSAHTFSDVTAATMHTGIINAACTYTMPTAAAGKSFSYEQTQDSTGSRIPTFTGVRWTGGTMPAASTAANAIDIYAFACFDGTHWDGVQVSKGAA